MKVPQAEAGEIVCPHAGATAPGLESGDPTLKPTKPCRVASVGGREGSQGAGGVQGAQGLRKGVVETVPGEQSRRSLWVVIKEGTCAGRAWRPGRARSSPGLKRGRCSHTVCTRAEPSEDVICSFWKLNRICT